MKTQSLPPPPPKFMSRRRILPDTRKRVFGLKKNVPIDVMKDKRRRLPLWGLLVVAGLVAGLVGLASLSNTAEGQSTTPSPTNVVVSSITDSGAKVTWDWPPNSCTPRWFTISLTDHHASILGSGRTHTFTGMTAETTYTFGMYAWCGRVISAVVQKTFTTLPSGATKPPPPPPPPPPSPPPGAEPNEPTNLTITDVTKTGATLTWTASAPGDCPTSWYDVEVNDTRREISWEDSVTGTTVRAGKLTPGTKYTASISAFSEFCDLSSEWVEKSFATVPTTPPTPTPTTPPTPTPTPTPQTGPPAPPANVQVSGVTGTGATIKWEAGTGDCPATGYVARLAANANTGQLLKHTTISLPAPLSWTINGLTPGTAYLVQVNALGNNCSGQSNGVSAYFTTVENLTLSVSDVTVTEGNSGTTAMNFTVTLSGSPSHKVEIRATSRGVGMATAPGRTPPTASGTGYGRDFFQFTGRNLVFEAGATGAALTKTVTVVVYGDELDEADETLILRLNNLRTEATNVSFAGGETSLEATGTISDDDEGKTPRVISVSNTTVAEGAEGDRTELTFTITLSATPSHDVQIRATVRGAGIKATLATTPTAKGTAGEGRDFIQFTNRDVVFAAGATGAALTQTVTVVILGDAVVEGDETLSLRLNNLRTDDGLVRFTGGAKRLFVTGTITDDDAN